MASQKPSFWWTPNGLMALGLIGAASYFLLIEHRAHLFEFLPYLILLACPLMHVFMHRGHGHQHADESDQEAYRRGVEDGRKDSEHRHHH